MGAPLEELGLLSRVRQYVQLRWLVVVVMLAGVAAGGVLLGIGVSRAVWWVAAGIALYNVAFSVWMRWHEQRGGEPEDLLRWYRRFALAQVIADLVALTVLLHFVGGVETPFFLFYLVHVGFGSIMLSRRTAYLVTGLAAGLYAALVLGEFFGWLPHVHLEGFVPIYLYRKWGYVAAVLVGFVVTLAVSTLGATAIVAALRRQWEQSAQTKERELQEISAKLEDLDRMRVFFLGLASHDLKTPLAVVASYLQAILDGFVGDVNEKQRRWMERANTRVLELTRLINDFLDVSQLAPDRIRSEVQPVALDGIVRRSLEEVRIRAEEKGISLQINVPARLPAIPAAPRRIQQVITNLLDNAIKFSPRQGEVVLEARPLGDGIQVDVVDTGPGIPALYLPHLFDDYFRARRKEFVPGAGLGLSTARKIVEAHGGNIWVQSPCRESEGGSCFSFTLPGDRSGATLGGE